MSIEMIDVEDFTQPRIKVFGVGGGGGNAVEYMITCGVQGVEFVAANTDSQALSRSGAHMTLHLGTSGLGADNKPNEGGDSARTVKGDIRSAIEGAHMVIITAGMGGGTGTHAAALIAKVAREMGVFTLGLVSKPFDWEGRPSMSDADAGLAALEANVDSLIVVLNEKLLDVLGDDVTPDEAFALANDVLKNAVVGIAEILNVPGLVNVDFEDVRTVFGEQGKAMIGTAEASGPDRARVAAEQAVACPLLEGIDLSSAKGLLISIAAAKGSLKLSESKLAMNTIRPYFSPDAHVIYGTSYDDNLGDNIRVTVVATGLSGEGSRRNALPMQVVLTGTDDAFGLPAFPPVNQVVGHGPPAGAGLDVAQSGGYGSADVPNVLRTNRTPSPVRVDAPSAGGRDYFDIPSFFLRQSASRERDPEENYVVPKTEEPSSEMFQQPFELQREAKTKNLLVLTNIFLSIDQGFVYMSLSDFDGSKPVPEHYLDPDLFERFSKKYRVNSSFDCRPVRMTDRGLLIAMDGGFACFVNASPGAFDIRAPSGEALVVGQDYSAKILSIDWHTQKIEIWISDADLQNNERKSARKSNVFFSVKELLIDQIQGTVPEYLLSQAVTNPVSLVGKISLPDTSISYALTNMFEKKIPPLKLSLLESDLPADAECSLIGVFPSGSVRSLGAARKRRSSMQGNLLGCWNLLDPDEQSTEDCLDLNVVVFAVRL